VKLTNEEGGDGDDEVIHVLHKDGKNTEYGSTEVRRWCVSRTLQGSGSRPIAFCAGVFYCKLEIAKCKLQIEQEEE
jgi:hypothetical protein